MNACPADTTDDDPSSAGGKASGATILVVEDEVLVRLALADELRDDGHTVVEAANADEALAVLRSDLRVDLLLSDIRMPGTLDGADLVRIVRAEHPHIKVIVMSGHLPRAALGVEVDGFLQKPFDLGTFTDYVRVRLD